MLISAAYFNSKGVLRCRILREVDEQAVFGGLVLNPVVGLWDYESLSGKSLDQGVNSHLVNSPKKESSGKGQTSRFFEFEVIGLWNPPPVSQEPIFTLKNRMFDFSGYERAFSQVMELLKNGICYQVNLCDRWYLEPRLKNLTPEEIFSYLWHKTKARYAAWIPLEEIKKNFYSFSPELFFQVSLLTEGVEKNRRKIQVKPIKGTVPRGNDRLTDESARIFLKQDPKLTAELWMITDLLRNDLAKLVEVDSLRTTDPLHLVETPYVYHLESMTEGVLKDEISLSQILEALGPSGSVTGTPKGCAMEAIKNLEQEPRGYYTGALGVIHKGEAIFSVVIRSFVEEDQYYTLGVGGGLVWGSKASEEWKEIGHKAWPFVN